MRTTQPIRTGRVREGETRIVNTSDGGIPDITHGVNSCEVYTLAVLTQDAAGLFAAYVAIVRNGDDNAAVRVTELGRKLNLTKARFFFPTLNEREYRV